MMQTMNIWIRAWPIQNTHTQLLNIKQNEKKTDMTEDVMEEFLTRFKKEKLKKWAMKKY